MKTWLKLAAFFSCFIFLAACGTDSPDKVVKKVEKAWGDYEGYTLQANMEMYTLLMKIDGRSRLMEKIVAYLKEKVRSVLEHTSVEAAKIDLAVEYVTSGMFMAYRYWFNSDRKQSLEDFTDDIATLVIGGLPTYFMEIE